MIDQETLEHEFVKRFVTIDESITPTGGIVRIPTDAPRYNVSDALDKILQVVFYHQQESRFDLIVERKNLKEITNYFGFGKRLGAILNPGWLTIGRPF